MQRWKLLAWPRPHFAWRCDGAKMEVAGLAALPLCMALRRCKDGGCWLGRTPTLHGVAMSYHCIARLRTVVLKAAAPTCLSDIWLPQHAAFAFVFHLLLRTSFAASLAAYAPSGAPTPPPLLPPLPASAPGALARLRDGGDVHSADEVAWPILSGGAAAAAQGHGPPCGRASAAQVGKMVGAKLEGEGRCLGRK